MAKDFKKRLGNKNLGSLIPTDEPTAAPPQPAPMNKSIEVVKPEKAEKQSDTEVTTFRVNKEKVRSIRAIAFWDRKKVQDVFDEAISMYIDQYSKSGLAKAREEYNMRNPPKK